MGDGAAAPGGGRSVPGHESDAPEETEVGASAIIYDRATNKKNRRAAEQRAKAASAAAGSASAASAGATHEEAFATAELDELNDVSARLCVL